MEQATAARSVDVVLGTYPKDAEPGSGEGMWSARFDRVTGTISDLRQVAQVAAPSFLATTVVSNTRMVYAVSEVPTGQVHGLLCVRAASSSGVLSTQWGHNRVTLLLTVTGCWWRTMEPDRWQRSRLVST